MIYRNNNRILAASSLTLALLAILSACSSESELRFTDSFIQDHDFTVELNAASNALDISFTPQSDASYQLTRSSESGCSADTCADYLALTINDDGTATDSLPADTYYYKLTVSLSGISEKFSAQYPPAGILPEDFTATAGNGQVTLSWTPYSDDTTYNIYRSSDSDCDLTNYTSCANNALFTSKSSPFVDDGLTNGTTYYYWIEATVEDDTERTIDPISAIPDASANILPDDFAAIAGDSQVTLSWTPYSDATIYNIYRSSDTDCDLDNYETACSATEGEQFTDENPSFVDSNLANYTTYYYWIEAVLNGVTQRSTNAMRATPSPNLLPDDFTATAGDRQVTLSWTPYSDATTYSIYRSRDSNCDLDNYNTACSASEGELFADIVPGFVDTDLTGGTTYYYWIEGALNGIAQRATNSIDATIQKVIIITETVPLNDTGIDWGGDYASGNNSDCTSNMSAPQDCDQGRDATDNDDSDGHAGFSFTKIDSSGNTLDASATEWSCVLDNVTGLIWEVKTDDGGLRDKDDSYNWYNTDPETNGGAVGSADDDGDICYGYDSSDASTYCNTEAFTARVNAVGLCGAKDWRMPTRLELRSIVDLSRTNPSIDTNYFPNAHSSSYWSASPDAYNRYDAWLLFFSYGDDGYGYRDYNSHVRLVRSGQ